jgi:hypothetical protein
MVEEGREDVRRGAVVSQEEIERDLERWLAQVASPLSHGSTTALNQALLTKHGGGSWPRWPPSSMCNSQVMLSVGQTLK